jgi:tetratricopeptide (TPR) repeat protein
MEIISPQQLADEGQAEYNRANYLEAARLYRAAADSYLSSGDKLTAAEMANNCSVSYLKGGNAEAALEATIGTDLLFAEKGDRLRQAMALGNQASAWEGLNQLDKAMSTYSESAELLNSLGEAELRAYVLQSISAIQLRRGQFFEAYATMGAGVMGLEKPNLSQKILKSLIQLPFKFIR